VDWGISLPRDCAGLCPKGWIRDSCVMSGAHLFVLSTDMQEGMELMGALVVVVRNGTKFSQCNVAWG
jgi:hypothetical protein